MNHSTPGFPVHHQLLEFTQTHVHWVGDTIQPSHPLLSPSPPAPNLSQYQGLFQWVSSSHQVPKVLLSFSFNISPSNEHSGLIFFRRWISRLNVSVKFFMNPPWRLSDVNSEQSYGDKTSLIFFNFLYFWKVAWWFSVLFHSGWRGSDVQWWMVTYLWWLSLCSVIRHRCWIIML